MPSLFRFGGIPASAGDAARHARSVRDRATLPARGARVEAGGTAELRRAFARR
jgi:hypothetical protein